MCWQWSRDRELIFIMMCLLYHVKFILYLFCNMIYLDVDYMFIFMMHLNSLSLCAKFVDSENSYVSSLGGPNHYAFSYSYALSYSRVNRSIGFCGMWMCATNSCVWRSSEFQARGSFPPHRRRCGFRIRFAFGKSSDFDGFTSII